MAWASKNTWLALSGAQQTGSGIWGQKNTWRTLGSGSGSGGAGSDTGGVNDTMYLVLGLFIGTNNDKLFAYLRSQGHSGTLADMIASAGGLKQVLRELDILK